MPLRKVLQIRLCRVNWQMLAAGSLRLRQPHRCLSSLWLTSAPSFCQCASSRLRSARKLMGSGHRFLLRRTQCSSSLQMQTPGRANASVSTFSLIVIAAHMLFNLRRNIHTEYTL